MKKILLSVLAIGVVAVVAVFATQAYFSDEEKSVGNTFTAGKLDLIFQVEGAEAQWTEVNGAPLFDGTVFPLNDLKPGDDGEKTVRMWVDNNPSCGTVSVNVTSDLDNYCTEPEAVDEGANCPVGGTEGELNDQVKFAVWGDDCNNILDGNETILVSGPLTGIHSYSFGELPTTQGTAKCYGIAYCFGTWNGTVCDGSLVNNSAQTDSFTADLVVNALQKRHQFPDGCPIGEITNGREHKLTLENETPVDGAPWIVIKDNTYGTLIWNGDGVNFVYSFEAFGLPVSTQYKLVYAPDPWPQGLTGVNAGKSTVLGAFVSDGSGNIPLTGGNSVNLTYDIPAPGDTNVIGGKIWLVLSADHDGTKMTSWNPGSYLYEGNVYINYDDTDN